MDFTDDQLDTAINSLSEIEGINYGALTGNAVPAEAKRGFIATTMGGIYNDNEGEILRPDNPAQFDPAQRGDSRRQTIGKKISQSLGGGSALSPVHLEGLMVAQILQSGIEGNSGFLKLDGIISEDEQTFLAGIAREYISGEETIRASFDTASGNHTQREELRLAAEQRAAQAQQEAAARVADIKAVQAGLQEQGFYQGEIDGQSSPQLADALYDYAYRGHFGLQTGEAAAYAIDKYGSGNIQVQLSAAIQNNGIGDASLAREMVAAGLKGRPLDFQERLASGDYAQITRAEALAHALDPNAGIQIDGILDSKTVGVAQAYTSGEFQGIPASLVDYSGRVVHASLRDAAVRGTLPAVPAEHLSDTENQTLTALGGMDTEAGRVYMANVIRENGADWYREGLEKAHQAQAPVVVQAHEITPRSMILNPETDTSPEIIAGIDIYNDTPAPQDLPADAPQDVKNLATAKNDYFNLQQQYGDPASGNFRAGQLGPGGFDRMQVATKFYDAEDKFLNMLDDITNDPQRLAAVQGYLAGLKSGATQPEPEQTPATPEAETPVAAIDNPALPQSTATFHVDGTPVLPNQSVAEFDENGLPVFARQSTPQLSFGADGMPVFADTNQPIRFSDEAERGGPRADPQQPFNTARFGNPLDGHKIVEQDPALAEALAKKYGGQNVAFAAPM